MKSSTKTLVALANKFAQQNNVETSLEKDIPTNNNKTEVSQLVSDIRLLATEVEKRYKSNPSEGWFNHKVTMWQLKKVKAMLLSAYNGNEEF